MVAAQTIRLIVNGVGERRIAGKFIFTPRQEMRFV
jgi:hypothetical protein